jgi:hypothetical protein
VDGLSKSIVEEIRNIQESKRLGPWASTGSVVGLAQWLHSANSEVSQPEVPVGEQWKDWSSILKGQLRELLLSDSKRSSISVALVGASPKDLAGFLCGSPLVTDDNHVSVMNGLLAFYSWLKSERVVLQNPAHDVVIALNRRDVLRGDWQRALSAVEQDPNS